MYFSDPLCIVIINDCTASWLCNLMKFFSFHILDDLLLLIKDVAFKFITYTAAFTDKLINYLAKTMAYTV